MRRRGERSDGNFAAPGRAKRRGVSIQLDNRVLNRTLLARQHLLARTTADVATVVEHLIGLQAQDGAVE